MHDTFKKARTFSLAALLATTASADIIPGDHHDFITISGSLVYMNQPALQVGGFGVGASQLGAADTVDVDRKGNIYVVDDVQRQIKVWRYKNTAGNVSEIIGSADTEAAGLGPLGDIQAIALSQWGGHGSSGVLFIIDRNEARDPEFRLLKRSGSGHHAHWQLLGFSDFQKTPNDLAIDRRGRLIVAEKKGRIEVLLADGSALDQNFDDDGILNLETVDGIDTDDFKAVDTDRWGNIYVSDKDNGRIIKLSRNGEALMTFGSQGTGEGQFLEQVEGLTLDWRGNVYGRDESGHRNLVFAPDGSFLTTIGSRGFEPHQQENADEFVVDRKHRRFIWADNNNYRASVHNMNRGWFLSRIFTQYDFPVFPVVQPAWIAGGTQGNQPGTEYDEPNELSFTANGNLWSGDVFNYRVQIHDVEGNFITTVGGEGNGACEFANPGAGKFGPEAIKPDSANRVYVVDRGGQKINIYDGDSFACLGEITSPLFDDPTGLVIDSLDNLYVADQGSDLIHQFLNDGSFVRSFQATDGGNAILAKTETLALDEGRDRLYASSEDKSRVEVFELSSGIYLDEHVGEIQEGVVPQDGRFVDDVEGIATATGEDWLLMSDEDNGRFMIHNLGSADLFDSDADFAYLASFGTLGSAAGQFSSADGVAVSEGHGLVAIADQGNYRIQVFRISDLKAQLGL